ncbi:MAG: PhnD/SsuA/transferrin family substrate-binding protein, partial [Kiritimatiellia bacterium]
DIEVDCRPWNAIRRDLQTGSLDAICGMCFTPERDSMVDFTPPLTVIHHAAFHRRGSPGIEHLTDLKGKKLIVMRKNIMHDYIIRQHYCDNPVLAETNQDALKMLIAGKGEFALLPKLPALHCAQRLKPDIITTGPAFLPANYCLAVKEGNHQLLARLREGLALLIRTGRRKEIADQWIGEIRLDNNHATRGQEIRIGVLTKYGPEKCLREWGLTIDYLNHALPDYRFLLIPLNFSEIESAVRANSIHFVLANPSMYINFQNKYSLQRIATLKNVKNSKESTKFGGVIFTRADNTHIQKISDLKGVSFMAVHEQSFGGWQVAHRELLRHGIKPCEDFSELQFGGTHEAVILAVRDGWVDAGTVRTDTLERMVEEGVIRTNDFRCLPHQTVNQETCMLYPFSHSTDLYPEWPLAQMKHTPDKWGEAVASTLISMPAKSPAAQAAGCAGWTVPQNYRAVHDCLRAIGAPPYDSSEQITIRDVWQRYRFWILLITAVLILISALSLSTSILSRKLAREAHRTKHLNHVLVAIRNINQLITHEQKRKELLRKACELLTENNSCQSVWILLLDKNQRFLFFEQAGLDQQSEQLINQFKNNEWPDCMERALTDSKTVFVKNPGKECKNCPVGDYFKNCGNYIIPLKYNSRIYGILSVAVPVSFLDDQEERNLFNEVSEDLAFALHDMDIEEQQKKAEKNLSNAIHSIESIVDNSPFPLWVANPEGTIVHTNRALRQTMASNNGRIINRYNVLKDPYLEQSNLISQIRLVFREHKKVRFLMPWKSDSMAGFGFKPDKNMFLDVAMFPIVNAAGELLNVICQWADITERIETEQQLAESEKRFRSYMDNSPHGVFVTNSSYSLIKTNPAVSQITGYTRDELLSMSLYNLLPDNAKAEGNAHFAHLYNEGNKDSILPFLKKNGTEGLWNITAVRLEDNTLLGFVHDVTEHIQMEKQLRRAQKLDAVGQLTGGIAHDFNNILMGVMGFTELCRNKLEKNNPTQKWLDEITNIANRSTNIVRQLLAFSRKQTVNPVILNINETVSEMIKMLERLIGENIKLQWTPGSTACYIRIDPGQIDQILANLCLNARDAIEVAGTIKIETEKVELNKDLCSKYVGITPGNYIRISVTDDGCGMDEKLTAKIFDPFFTTKPEGRGTGLGLATVYGIVKQNKGNIDIMSEPGRGTTFTIHLPCYEHEENELQPEKAAGQTTDRNKTILLVEDESSIRMISRIFLREAGYKVLEADSSDKAIELVENSSEHIDLLLTDIIMPGMSGNELADKLSNIISNLKILYISGYVPDNTMQQKLLKNQVEFMSKPIMRQELLARIAAMLSPDKSETS